RPYYVRDGGVVLDPVLPSDDVVEWLSEHGPPRTVLLTSRHHYRHTGRLVEAFDVSVHASSPGMHEFTPEQRVAPFDFGDELPGGVVAHEVGAICPDETALQMPSARAVAFADGLVRYPEPDGALGFVPDFLMGNDPEGVKRGMREAFARLLALDFDH